MEIKSAKTQKRKHGILSKITNQLPSYGTFALIPTILVFRKPVAEIEYCITRLDNGVIHDLVWPNDAEMEVAFLAIGRTVITGDAAANVKEEVGISIPSV